MTFNAPSNLTATVMPNPTASIRYVALHWQDNSTEEAGFGIQRTDISGSSSFSLLAQVGQNVVSFNDYGVINGSLYSYRVIAAKSPTGSFTNWSNTASVTV